MSSAKIYRRVAIRVPLIVCLVLMFVTAASAYTLVMRDGRKIEIPAQFTTTKSTLTYEVSPTIHITVLIAAIDVAATERANGEAPGSLLARKTLPRTTRATVSTLVNQKAKRSVTNRDLASFARTRIQSEAVYDKRRRELGLPSIEESRLRREAEAERIRQELMAVRADQSEEESYWRTRGSELRTEIAAADAEITFVRTRLDELTGFFFSQPSFTVVTNAFPIGFGNFGGRGNFGVGRFGHFGRGGHRGGHIARPQVFVAPRGMQPLVARVGFRGGPIRARVGINTGGFHQNFPFGRFQTRGFGRRSVAVAPSLLPFQNYTSFSSGYDAYDLSYERSALAVRLNELVGHRAALRARWRELEEEARRAGVPPGWLRP